MPNIREDYYIIEGAINGQKIYIINTNPIIWGDNSKQAKRYYDLDGLLGDIKAERNILEDGIKFTNLEAVYVCKLDYLDNFLGRRRYL